MTEQIQSLLRRLEYTSRDLKVLWRARIVFSVYLGGNRRWVPLILSNSCTSILGITKSTTYEVMVFKLYL